MSAKQYSVEVTDSQRRALELVKEHGWLARWPNNIWAPQKPPASAAPWERPSDMTKVVRGSTVRSLIKTGRLEFRGGAARIPLRKLIEAKQDYPGCSFHACPACVALEEAVK